MVLIVEQEGDTSSRIVSEWIQSIGGNVHTISTSDTIEMIEYTVENGNHNFVFRHNGSIFNINQFTAIWFRRGWFTVMYIPMDALIGSKLDQERESLERHIKSELKTLQEHLYNSLSKRWNVFGNVNRYDVNKLDTLSLAEHVGLTVPTYCITTLKTSLLAFQEKQGGRLLSKAIRENIDYRTEKKVIYHVNNVFTQEEIEALPPHFQATLFQVYCEKHFEIRVFVFSDNVYAMAIFSQQNKKTQTDYRNYDNQKPTRCLPFTLPNDLKTKVMKLMKFLELKTGSIDFMYSKENEYVFLEVNPVGQFGIVSRSGNFYIEKEIAQTLTL